ncbi:hypothetical protein BaRGS_00036198 [Batillaria attramentaria]|uniref:Uncharacterized protein n=1 Tax=Batillaria attramentaria TaxID=370345 RepID=A0ABD0JCB1_9CAEN
MSVEGKASQQLEDESNNGICASFCFTLSPDTMRKSAWKIPYVGGRYSLLSFCGPNTYDAETGLPDLEQRLEERVTLHVDDGKPRDDVDDSVRVGVTDDETVFGPESDNGTGETDKDRENDESDHYHLLYPTADDDLDEYEGDYDYGED